MEELQKRNTENNLMIRVSSQEGRMEKDIVKDICSTLIQPEPCIGEHQIRETKSFNNKSKKATSDCSTEVVNETAKRGS